METRADVVIVSVGLRGIPLARSLRRDGLSVALVDVTSEVGHWDESDWEGLFGCFVPDKGAQMDHGELGVDFVLRDLGYREQPGGLAIWAPDGPIQMRAQDSGEMFHRKQMDPATLNWKSETIQNTSQWGKSTFKTNWLGHFGFWFGTTSFDDHPDTWGRRPPLPLADGFHFGLPSVSLLAPALQELAREGVRVYSPAKLVDLSFHGRLVDGIEIASERSGVVSGHRFVWMLTSEESYRCASRVGEGLFPSGPLESQWCWLRYRGKWADANTVAALPRHLVWIQDLGLPWTHANCFVTQKHVSGIVDCFCLVPSPQRIERSYVLDVGRQVAAVIWDRVPGATVEWLKWPTEVLVPLEEVGPPRFPVFEPRQQQKLNRANFRNVAYCNPETWRRYDWAHQLEQTRSVQRDLLAWWLKELVRRGEASHKSRGEASSPRKGSEPS